jgi:glycosyltransferase 2 family protein
MALERQRRLQKNQSLWTRFERELFMKNFKEYLFNFLKVAIGAGLLIFLFTRLEDPQLLWQKTLNANRTMLLAAFFTHTLAVALSALKWGWLLRAQNVRVTTPRLLGYQWMAIFFDNFFPAQVGGDILRGYSLAQETHRRADAAASVIIDRFTGLTAFMVAAAVASTALLVWGGLPSPVNPGDRIIIDLRLISLGSISVSLALFTAMGLMFSRRLKRWTENLISRLPLGDKVLPIWQKLAEAINAYRHSYSALLVAGATSLLIVVITSLTIWLLANAISPGSITFLDVLVINPILAFLAVIPLSPGGLGVRQFFFAALFVTVGSSWDLGLFVGLLQQLIVYVVSVPGLFVWMRGKRKIDAAEAPVLAPDIQPR